MRRLITTLLFSLCMLLIACATTRYSTPHNHYATLPLGDSWTSNVLVSIDDDLVIDNSSDKYYCLADTTPLPSNYRYSVILSNLNNKPGKSTKVNGDNRPAKVTDSRWGVFIDADGDGNMTTVELSCNNSQSRDEIARKRTMTVSLNKCDEHGVTTLCSKTLDHGVDITNGANTLTVEVNGNNIRVLMGRKKTFIVMETTIERKANYCHAGLFAGPGAKLKVERTMLRFDDSRRANTTTQWTPNNLDAYLHNSTDPIEGYWQYLDRETDDKWLKLGGRYRIALVKNETNGYDIIYCNGAQVNDKAWKPCMLKGRITRTIFGGNYEAMWIDSMMEPLAQDVQATIENGVILAVRFPVFKSQLRFSKVLE